ncbi:MAG TPA: ribosome silencing factor [Candidatus Limnocylindria bacterium]|jgi:ribosome-associated protein|nr:ribosome silencing factor [Candidatus Limnocylindria bacterium]
MDSRKLALLCRKLADDKKAENIVVLDVRKLSSVTDYFVIATGTSGPHLRAIESSIVDTLRNDYHLKPHNLDGSSKSNWIAADYFDVIVHVMNADVRAHYDLEGLWADAPRVRTATARRTTAKKADSEIPEPALDEVADD